MAKMVYEDDAYNEVYLTHMGILVCTISNNFTVPWTVIDECRKEIVDEIMNNDD